MGYPLTSDFTAINRKELLSRLYGLSANPSRSTIWEWMTRSGFSYTKRKKRYFVDTHESKANRQYRKEQTARYLRGEQRMFRWYQLPLDKAQKLASQGFLVAGRGYIYKTINGGKTWEKILYVSEKIGFSDIETHGILGNNWYNFYKLI